MKNKFKWCKTCVANEWYPLRPPTKYKKHITAERARALVACAYAKGVADGANHMLKAYREEK